MNVGVVPMRQLREALGGGDDWTGVTDPTERRKRQNRLHQRAWRRRKNAQMASSRFLDQDTDEASQRQSIHIRRTFTPPTHQIHNNNGPSESKPRRLILPPIAPLLATANFMSLLFPLSADHQLITLVQYNVLRAIFTNTAIISLASQLPPMCQDVAATMETMPTWAASNTASLPSSLAPTALQITVPHEPWIGIVPFAAMRDNLIRHTTAIDAAFLDVDDFCDDMVGGLYDGFSDVQSRGLVVWGDPWDDGKWEVTEGFARKWGFLLRGCDALMAATNRWRGLRGEDLLVVEV